MAKKLPRAKQSQTKFYLDPQLKQEYQEILKIRKTSMNIELERFIRLEVKNYKRQKTHKLRLEEKNKNLGGENIENSSR
ncbi:MAG: hypothetical protein SPI91_00615 [Bacilli bacterium]|nr:hypothetical protein [Bacilli bacterium]